MKTKIKIKDAQGYQLNSGDPILYADGTGDIKLYHGEIEQLLPGNQVKIYDITRARVRYCDGRGVLKLSNKRECRCNECIGLDDV
jgi:hypothetical protein